MWWSFYDSLVLLKLTIDCFFRIKIIKKLYTVLYADEDMLYFNEDADNVIFCCNKMGIHRVNYKNISRDNNFDEDDPDNIILVTPLAYYIKLGKGKSLKKG